MLDRGVPWDALGSAPKKDVRVRLVAFTTALPGDTRYAPGAGAINVTKIGEAFAAGAMTLDMREAFSGRLLDGGTQRVHRAEAYYVPASK